MKIWFISYDLFTKLKGSTNNSLSRVKHTFVTYTGILLRKACSLEIL